MFNYLRSLWSESKHRDKIKTGRLIARIYYAINQTVKGKYQVGEKINLILLMEERWHVVSRYFNGDFNFQSYWIFLSRNYKLLSNIDSSLIFFFMIRLLWNKIFKYFAFISSSSRYTCFMSIFLKISLNFPVILQSIIYREYVKIYLKNKFYLRIHKNLFI